MKLPKLNNQLLELPTNLLAIVAHPDDELLGPGGTLIKNQKLGGKSLVICFGGKESNRYKEFKKSCKKLNLNNIILRKEEGKYHLEERKTINFLKSKIIDFKPEFVVTHRGEFDYHPDHRYVSKISKQAATNAQTPKKGWILKGFLYFEASSMHPFVNIFVDTSKTTKDVIEGMKEYKSQLKKNNNYYLKTLKARLELRGTQAGCKFAEAFIFEPLNIISGFNRRNVSV